MIPPLLTNQSYCMDDEPDRLSNRLLQYDPNTNKWRELRPMKYSKYRCCAVVLSGEIFVMGKIFCSASINKLLLMSCFNAEFCTECCHVAELNCNDFDKNYFYKIMLFSRRHRM